MGRPWTRGWNTKAFPLRLAPTCLFPTAQNQSLPKDDKGEDKKTKKSKEIKPTEIAKSMRCEHRSHQEENCFHPQFAFPLNRTFRHSLTVKLIYCAEIISVAGELI